MTDRFTDRASVSVTVHQEHRGDLARAIDAGLTAAWRDLERAYATAGDAEAAVDEMLPHGVGGGDE